MRRPFDTVTALQVLTAIVPVTLLLAVVLAEVRRSPALVGHGTHTTRILPRCLTRLFHHGVATKPRSHGAQRAVQSLQVLGAADAQ